MQRNRKKTVTVVFELLCIIHSLRFALTRRRDLEFSRGIVSGCHPTNGAFPAATACGPGHQETADK